MIMKSLGGERRGQFMEALEGMWEGVVGMCGSSGYNINLYILVNIKGYISGSICKNILL